MSYQKILVPIDFSEDSIAALTTATREFANASSMLILLHVFDASNDQAGPSQIMSRGRMQAVSRMGVMGDEQDPEKSVQERVTQLKTLAAPIQGAWKQVDTLVTQGQPIDDIIAAASHHKVDLVIMGSHGQGGLGKMLFGSTTYDVARKVRCSVLINKRA